MQQEGGGCSGWSINPPFALLVLPESLWRNGIARWTSNPEAPGSSPGRDGSLATSLIVDRCFFFMLRLPSFGDLPDKEHVCMCSAAVIDNFGTFFFSSS